jgi:metal iron transporter
MNCPVRTDPLPDEGHNQNPPALAPELTTRRSMTSRRSGSLADGRIDLMDGSHGVREDGAGVLDREKEGSGVREVERVNAAGEKKRWGMWNSGGSADGVGGGFLMKSVRKVRNTLVKYVKFIGPGFMVAVAYIDPGAYFSRNWNRAPKNLNLWEHRMLIAFRKLCHGC